MEKDIIFIEKDKIYTNLELAFIGDIVYGYYIKLFLFSKMRNNNKIHKKSSYYVSAKFQATIFDEIKNKLFEKEIDIYKRGKNTKIHSHSKGSNIIDYKKATGIETLIGYLYIYDKVRLYKIIKEILKLVV